jgi:hypothetical protein
VYEGGKTYAEGIVAVLNMQNYKNTVRKKITTDLVRVEREVLAQHKKYEQQTLALWEPILDYINQSCGTNLYLCPLDDKTRVITAYHRNSDGSNVEPYPQIVFALNRMVSRRKSRFSLRYVEAPQLVGYAEIADAEGWWHLNFLNLEKKCVVNARSNEPVEKMAEADLPTRFIEAFVKAKLRCKLDFLLK